MYPNKAVEHSCTHIAVLKGFRKPDRHVRTLVYTNSGFASRRFGRTRDDGPFRAIRPRVLQTNVKLCRRKTDTGFRAESTCKNDGTGKKKNPFPSPSPVRITQHFTAFGMRRRSEKGVKAVNVFLFRRGVVDGLQRKQTLTPFRRFNRRTVKNFSFSNS